MNLELFVKKYFVIETKTQTFFDKIIGVTGDPMIDYVKKQYGPYISENIARKKIEHLKEKRIKEGWQQDEDLLKDFNLLVLRKIEQDNKKRPFDIKYKIDESFEPYSFPSH